MPTLRTAGLSLVVLVLAAGLAAGHTPGMTGTTVDFEQEQQP